MYSSPLNRQSIVEKISNEILGSHEPHISYVKLDPFLRHKRILVTGAGGFIGQKLVDQIISHSPGCLLAFDHQEFGLHQIQTKYELGKSKLKSKPQLILGSTLDQLLLENIFETYKPELIFHAAAYKHVHLVQENPHVGYINNVIGTKNVAQMAIDHCASHLVLVSSDKAIEPVGAMGMSKHLSELIIFYMAKKHSMTDFLTVRFGNVFGSSGSVINKILDQLFAGNPITITNSNAERFFMSANKAIDLTLQSTQLYRQSGDILAFDMGAPHQILQLIHQVIGYYTLLSNTKITPCIKEIGLYPGERLREPCLINGTSIATEHPKIYRQSQNCKHPEFTFWNLIDSLEKRWNLRQDFQDILDQLLLRN